MFDSANQQDAMHDEFIEIAIQFPFGTAHHLYRMNRDAAGPFALIASQPGQPMAKFRLEPSRIETGPGVPGARLRYQGPVKFLELVMSAG
jgi:hypothetical protein